MVPVVGDERARRLAGRALRPVLYPRATAPRPAPRAGCPRVRRRQRGRAAAARVRRPATAVAPGLHRPEAGAHQVVWWDPRRSSSTPGAASDCGSSGILEADESGGARRRASEAHAAWQRRARGDRSPRGAAPSRASRWPRPPSAAAGAAPAAAGRCRRSPQPTPSAGDRTATRFGTLVHAMLAAVDLDAAPTRSRRAPSWRGGCSARPADEVTAAADAASRALAHPLLRRAAAAARAAVPARDAGRVRRSTTGRSSRASSTSRSSSDDGWTVVDFKTDVEIGGRVASTAARSRSTRSRSRARRAAARGVSCSGCEPPEGRAQEEPGRSVVCGCPTPLRTDVRKGSKRGASPGGRKSAGSPRAPCRS